MSIASVSRELLVRYLDIWTPGALHGSRRATFVQAWAGDPDPETVTGAVRVFGEFADRLAGRELSMVLIAADPAPLTAAIDAVRAEYALRAGFGVYPVAGTPRTHLTAALGAARPAGAPLLAHVVAPRASVDAPDGLLPALARAGKPAEVLLVTEPGNWAGLRSALGDAGFGLTAGVEMVAPDVPARLVAFGTGSGKRLEAFKDALWAVDEYAGVRYRDPRDPDGDLLDISLKPQPAPLRRELLRYLAEAGPSQVTDIRRFTLTGTVYRTSDTTRALTALLTSGAAVREPGHGRLSGDVVISLPAAPDGPAEV